MCSSVQAGKISTNAPKSTMRVTVPNKFQRFGFGGQRANAVDRFLRRFAVGGGDVDRAVVGNIDFRAVSSVIERIILPPGSELRADFIRVKHNRDDARRVFRKLFARFVDCCAITSQNMQATFRACSKASCKIIALAVTLMSICKAVMPPPCPTLKSISP